MFFRKAKKIKELEAENNTLVIKVEELKDSLQKYKKRLRRAGSDPREDLTCGQMRTIEVEPIMFGSYVCMSRDAMIDEQIERAKKQITEKIVKGLIDSELVQFIVNDDGYIDPLNQFGTVGAKLRVIPWEECSRTVKMIVQS